MKDFKYISYTLNKLSEDESLAREFILMNVLVESVKYFAGNMLNYSKSKTHTVRVSEAEDDLLKYNIIDSKEKAILKSARALRNLYTHDLHLMTALVINPEDVYESEMSMLDVLNNLYSRYGVDLEKSYNLTQEDIQYLNKLLHTNLIKWRELNEDVFGDEINNQKNISSTNKPQSNKADFSGALSKLNMTKKKE